MGESAPTTSPLVRRYSIEEFFALDAPVDGGHYELIGGVLYMVPPPGSPHNLVASRLNRLLSRYCDVEPVRGMLFVPRAAVWTTDTYLEPDLWIVTPERLAATPDGRFTAADLVVEIVSPSSALYDRNTKADTYAALGVRELWLVDPDAKIIEVRDLTTRRLARDEIAKAGGTAVSRVFAGLVVPVDGVFG